MSEEPEKTAKPVSEPSRTEAPEAVEHDAPETAPAAKTTIPPYLGIGLLVAALLVVLLVMMSRNRGGDEKDDEKSVSAVNAELEAVRSEVNRQRLAMGLRPLEGGSESIDLIAKRLSKDAETIVGLANSFESLLKEKDAELDAKNSELIRSEKLRQSLGTESARLQSELQRALVSGADGDLARKELSDIKDQKDRLMAALVKAERDLKATAGGKSEEEYAVLQRRFDETVRARDFFEKRVKELEGELGRLRIFAKSETELLPEAVELFRTLRGLEGTKDSDNMKAYSDIGVNLGAKVLKTLSFQTGSSMLTPDEELEIRGLVDQIADGDLVLVVGYASTTGNVEANRLLSSDRATAAAQTFSIAKRPEQMVQAVYIGQTKRFSGSVPESNQLCEIWHIKAR